MIATSGRWSPSDGPIYFFSGRESVLTLPDPTPALIAVPQITPEVTGGMKRRLNSGAPLLIDSGVYTLLADHARTHDLTMAETARLRPAELDGHDEALDAYLTVARALHATGWGLIEWDAGNADDKARHRAELHAEDIYPIPVWHAATDSLAHLRDLIESHDRIAISHYGTTSPTVRSRLAATVNQVRAETEPDVWIHQLGMSPSWWHLAWPFDSCDSSTWLQVLRWPDFDPRITPRQKVEYPDLATFRRVCRSALRCQALDLMARAAAVTDARTLSAAALDPVA